MNYNHDTKKLNINTSGKDGSSGSDGSDGSWYGSFGHGDDGDNAENGRDGTHAKDIFISLSADASADAVVVKTRDEVCALPLGDADVTIFTKARGGAGGDGGRGGHGGRGHDGFHGTDATMYCPGTNGGHGANGGDGGDGGNGGNGGNGGDVTIEVKQQDTDLLMLFATPEMKGGDGGSGGRGGSGGQGGIGGRGGNSYSWSEPVYHPHQDKDGNTHTDVTYVPHTTPGGFNGSSGLDGSSGRTGSDGSSGKNGTLTIRVDDGNTYHGVYDLSLESIADVQSDDGIIEPGESLAIQNVTFKNTGYMPTPAHHAVQVTLTPNKWITFNARNTVSLSGPIAPGYSQALEKPVLFDVNLPALPHAVNSTFQETGKLQFNARMSRVNKDFSDVARELHTFNIRYPVEISTVAIPPVIARGEEAPFVVKVRNVSTKPIGMSAHDARLLEVKLAAGDAKAGTLTYLDAETSQTQSLVTPVIDTINLLNAGQAAYFTGSIKFPDLTPAYVKSHLNFKLYLGALENPEAKQNVIQQRNIQLQLADRYVYDANADLVLVTNNNTNPETVTQWKEKARMMGTTLSVWNTSLYSGLSYTKTRQDRMNFFSQMQGKVIIILNNEMNINDRNTHSTDCLDAMEILEAAKDANISTYVIGGNFNLKNAITPLTHISRNDETYVVEDRYFFWRQPKPEHLMKKAAEINKQLQKNNPEQRFVPVVHFEAERKTTARFSLRPKWELGKIEARETLGQTQAHIALRNSQADVLLANNADVFNVLKLMPFAKKLQYLDKAVQRVDHDAAKMISTAILSDLTDELMTFAKDKWNGAFSKEKLSAALVNLKLMSEHPFTPSNHLSSILTNYNYIANRLPTNYDKYLFPFWCRRIRLRNICQHTINDMLKHYFPVQQFDYSKRNLEVTLGRLPREVVFERFAAPYKNDVKFDNQLNVTDPVRDNTLPAYQKKKSTFTERFNLFSSSGDRKKYIESQKSNCKFEL